MSDSLHISEIKKRSLSGAKWLILTNALGIPITYATTLLLGRTNEATLGAYALVQIFLGVITTFVMFGGPAVLRNFMPKVHNANDRGAFIFSYGIILAGLSVGTLMLFYFVPCIPSYLLQRKFEKSNIGWFAILTILAVSAEYLMGAVAGLMQVKLASIARAISRIILLLLVAGFFFFKPSLLLDTPLEIIFGGFLIAYIIGIILCVIGLRRDPRFHMHFQWNLPSGFLSFALTSSAGMIFSFLYLNFDRLCLLTFGNLDELGIYQAVLSLAILNSHIPKMISTGLVPTFSSLLANGEQKAIQNGFLLIQRFSTISISLISFTMIAFSRELLSLFGEKYTEYHWVLSLFCFQSTFTSLFLGNTAILTSYEKNLFRFSTSFFQICLQGILTLTFIKTYGILAIVGAKVISVSLAQSTITVYVTRYLNEGFRIPRSYWAGCLAAGLALIAKEWLLPKGWGGALLTLGMALSVFWAISGLTISECKSLKQLLIQKN